MKRKLTIVLALLLLLLGVGVLSYPTLSNYINQRNGSAAIQTLNEQTEQTVRGTVAEERRKAETYNAALSGAIDSDAFGAAGNGEYYDILDFGNGVMGYIQIPKIGVSLPIYHGVTEQALTKGVGHLPQSAFPIGGEGSHAVLSGHTGLPTAKLFTDLTELEIGDLFYIYIPEQNAAYQVDQIKVVLPSETEDLMAVPGADYCTLVTCTPYGINSHRLLVRGSRITLEQEAPEVQQTSAGAPRVPFGLVAAAVAAAALLGCIAAVIFAKKKG